MKKFLGLFLASILVSSALVGCSGSTAEGDTTKPSAVGEKDAGAPTNNPESGEGKNANDAIQTQKNVGNGTPGAGDGASNPAAPAGGAGQPLAGDSKPAGEATPPAGDAKPEGGAKQPEGQKPGSGAPVHPPSPGK